jgi:hypothetical protein
MMLEKLFKRYVENIKLHPFFVIIMPPFLGQGKESGLLHHAFEKRSIPEHPFWNILILTMSAGAKIIEPCRHLKFVSLEINQSYVHCGRSVVTGSLFGIGYISFIGEDGPKDLLHRKWPVTVPYLETEIHSFKFPLDGIQFGGSRPPQKTGIGIV